MLLAGCGYQFGGQGIELPGKISRLKIDLFANQTSEPYLESYITASTTLRLMRQHDVQLVETTEDAEAVLSGEVLQYQLSAAAYDAVDDIQSYRITMKIQARMTRLEDGKILWQDALIRYEDFVSNGSSITDQEDLETAAQKSLSIRLAEDLAWQMSSGFGSE